MNDIKKLEELIANLNYLYNKEIETVEKAYYFVCNKCKDFKLEDLDEYILHPLNVAFILSNLRVDAITIISALLHGCLKQGIAEEEIEKLFGEDVLKIVKSITVINKLSLDTNDFASSIYLRKVLVGLSEDVRVLFVKLADRLHNMRSIWTKKPENHLNKVLETEKVLIPIAHRLGIYGIKSELEDLCLKYSKPDIYNDILAKLNSSKNALNEVLEVMQEELEDILIENGISFSIKSRVKSVYSIYKKLEKGKKWKEIYDILALRIIVEKESDCYLTIGLIHAKYRPLPNRFKDYIAMPKENMYQSLHTGVIGIDGNMFEIQVRTIEMDEIAEKGIASHWSYKENNSKKIQNIMEQKLELFRNVIETYNNEDIDEFDKIAKDELLNEMIYVFTPSGDVIELPSGSTPIDFAYRIHTKVGDTTVGAIVNGEIVPLSHNLQNNDIIKINTNKSGKPSHEWLSFVKTNSAKSKIKAFFSKQDREFYIDNGKNILEKELKKNHLTFNEIFNKKGLDKVLTSLKITDFDEIYLNLGALRYTANYIIKLATSEDEDILDALTGKFSKKRLDLETISKNDILIDNLDNILVTKAKCCNPVKGDKIIGFITKGSGISIHKKNCPNIINRTDRLIKVSWNMASNSNYTSVIEIESISDKNYITEIINKATVKKINVSSINTKLVGDIMYYNLKVLVKDTDELNDFVNALKSFKYFRKVNIK